MLKFVTSFYGGYSCYERKNDKMQIMILEFTAPLKVICRHFKVNNQEIYNSNQLIKREGGLHSG